MPGQVPLSTSLLTSRHQHRLRGSLLQWYRQYRRPLPWRQTRDPYHIWVSEIMLQQTRVSTVIPYYREFLRRFPTLDSLAHSPLEPVLLLWSGLGYYSRARNLRKAAGIIQERHQGLFPREYAQVRALPGIGEYTAAAVLSIAFNQGLAAVDGNVVRVLARLFRLEQDLSKNPGKQQVRGVAQALVSPIAPGEFNQAVMELGAMICTPRSPHCLECPWAAFCQARLAGVQEKIPRKKKRPKIETVTLSQFVIQQGRRILLVHRQGEKQLHGFWDFPSLTPPEGKKGKHSLAKALQRELGIEIPDLRKLADLEHGITRFRYRIQVWRVEIAPGRRPLLPGQGCHWVKASDLGKYPMALVARKIAAMV